EEQVAVNEKTPTRGAFAEPSDGLEPSTPSLPSRFGRNRVRLEATVRKESWQVGACLYCPRLAVLASALLHRCSTLRCPRGGTRARSRSATSIGRRDPARAESRARR